MGYFCLVVSTEMEQLVRRSSVHRKGKFYRKYLVDFHSYKLARKLFLFGIEKSSVICRETSFVFDEIVDRNLICRMMSREIL